MRKIRKLISHRKMDLNEDLIRELDLKCITAKENIIFTYKGQIPIAACFIESGMIRLKKNGEVRDFYTENFIIGFQEVLYGVPLKFDIEICHSSKIYLLGKENLKNIAPDSKFLISEI